MKRILSVLILGYSLVLMGADSKSDSVIPQGLLKFNETASSQIFQYYKILTGKTLVISAHVPLGARITIQPDMALKVSEAIALTEKSLLDQAGIILTKIDEQRVSVTYNEALPVSIVKDAKPVPQPVDDKPLTTPIFPPKQ